MVLVDGIPGGDCGGGVLAMVVVVVVLWCYLIEMVVRGRTMVIVLVT